MDEKAIIKIKEYASSKTGIPVELIKGETAEEIAASAIALAVYTRDNSEETTARETFQELRGAAALQN